MTAPPPCCSARRTTPLFSDLTRRGRSPAEFPLQSDDYVAALVEKETAHMPVEGYPQKLQRRYGDRDLAALRRDAVDRIWKVSSVNRWDLFFVILVRC